MWYSQPASEEHPITPNRPLRKGCIWQHYGAREIHQISKTISRGLDVEYLIIWFNRDVCFIGETPNRPVTNGHYSQPATEERRLYGALGHIKHWKPCQGDLMCYFGTNDPFLIYASCVILPTGQWGTPHFSQPATEEWMHLTALWGTWNTLNIENHLGGHWCGLFDHMIQSRCLSYRGDSQPASEERPLLPTGHWGTLNIENHVKWTWCVISGERIPFFGIRIMCDTPNRPLRNIQLPPTGRWGMDAFDSTMGQVKHIKHWKPSWGPICVIFEHIIQSRCLLIGETPNRPVTNAHYSQPATEERRLYGAIKHIKHWKPSLGDLMCCFGTNNRLLIYPWCVILPTGQWGTHHCSQPATEEWMHLSALYGARETH